MLDIAEDMKYETMFLKTTKDKDEYMKKALEDAKEDPRSAPKKKEALPDVPDVPDKTDEEILQGI